MTQPIEPAAADPGVHYIGNAGLVLVHPFLPMLFRRLGFIETAADGAQHVRKIDGARAVHVLQYLVDRRGDAAEPELVLNKQLCGLARDFPASPIELDDHERASCDELLHAVLGNWPSMHSTSSSALRVTFLQREGQLEWRDGACALTVRRKTVDVLREQLPWHLNIVAHPWMPQHLKVTW